METIHFLHISKTGGTAIKHALQNAVLRENIHVEMHNHKTTLKDIPEGEKFIITLRDPIQRFISALYSRKRKGKPRYYYEWSKIEKEIFTTFDTTNMLEEAIDTNNKHTTERELALIAMHDIKHFASLNQWCVSIEYFYKRIDDLYHICYQENLNSDFDKLKMKMDSPNITLPTDDTSAHKNPKNLDKHISSKAEKNLKAWYQDDYSLLEAIKRVYR